MSRAMRALCLLAMTAVAACGRNVVVTLQEPPLGVSNKRLRSRAVQEQWTGRKERIQEQQRQLIDNLPKEWKVAKVMRENGVYRDAITSIVSNTVTIDVGDEPLKEVAEKLRGIVPFVSVDNVRTPKLLLYSSRKQIGTEEALAELGATEELDAGKGVKIAICDNGNYVGVDMMNDEGFTLPDDLPADVGEVENCNNKLIVSKKYGFDHSYQEPKDENHGIHTSSTAGGRLVNATFGSKNYTISGIAPGAWMMNYRFVGGGGDIYEIFDDVVNDGADISSNSWGYDPFYNSNDAHAKLFDNAIKSGVVVVEAAGNSGPDPCTVSGLSRESIVVGAVNKYGLMGTISMKVKPNMDKHMSCSAYVYGSTNKTFFKTMFVEDLSNTSSYSDVDEDTAIFVQLPADLTLAEVVDIVSEAGAGLLVIGSDEVREQEQPKMPTVVCSSLQVTQFGEHYKEKGPGNVTLSNLTSNRGDCVTDFSSRGPSVDMKLTPDVVAPGKDILAAGYCAGCKDPRLGYNQVSGTSMATPHVSGAAAIILQKHPEFTPSEVRSALMTTAEYKKVMDSVTNLPAQPLEMGAGRIDLEKAIDPVLYIDPPRVDFSISPRGGNYTENVRVSKYRAGTMNIAVKIVSHSGYDAVEPFDSYIYPSPELFTLTDEKPSENITFVFDTEDLELGDQNAYVVFEDADTGDEVAHIPLWGQVTCNKDEVKDALVIVLDQSKCNSNLEDENLTAIYKETFDEMNVTYDVFEYCYKKSSPTNFRLPEKAVGLCYRSVFIGASQVNPSNILSGEGDLRRMMHAGVPVVQMGGTIGAAWGYTKSYRSYAWKTTYIMDNEFYFPSPDAWDPDNWISVTDVDIMNGTKMPHIKDNVEIMYSTDGGYVLISTMKYQPSGVVYSKNFNSVGVTSVVGLDHFLPTSRLEIMNHLYGYVTEDKSAFTIELGSNDKILTLNITGDTSDGLDHSIYYLVVYWGDRTFTPGTVGKINLLDTHKYPEYGTYEVEIFLVSAYQNSYGYSFNWTLTKGEEPLPEESQSSSDSSSSKESSSSSSAPVPPSPPTSPTSSSSAPKDSSSDSSRPSPDPQDSSSSQVDPPTPPPFVPLPSETKESSSELSGGKLKDDSSNHSKSINIGWVALIFIACIVVMIGGMFLFLKISSRKHRGTAYNELELDN